MQGYRDSTAYDFERFAPKKPNNIVQLPGSEPQRQKKSPARIQAEKKARQRAVLVKVVACATVLFLMIGLRIFGSIKQTELTAEIHSTKTSIERLKSESVRLEMELASAVAYTNLEKAAVDLGMQKQQPVQTVCLMLNDEDQAEIVNQETPTGLWAQLKAWF